MSGPLVRVEDLRAWFPVREGLFSRVTGHVRAVDGVSFVVNEGETLALVGESGCGKTTTGRTILRLSPATSGSVRFRGQDVFALPRGEMRRLRRKMQIVFQDPYGSLNPRMTVGAIVEEGLKVHAMGSRAERRDAVAETLRRVGLSPDHAERYPHEFSGGQRQRVGIARALVLRPEFVVLDEPVSALDVSVQAQIVNLLAELREEMGLSYLFIAHDLAVVRHLADRVAVMYLGRIVEEGPTEAIFDAPAHPYTRALLSAIPAPDPGSRRLRIRLPGEPPSPIDPPSGCSFHPRCPSRLDRCSAEDPGSYSGSAPGHAFRCFLAEEAAAAKGGAAARG